MTLTLVGRKIGMLKFFNDKGELVPCTLIHFESPNVVTQVKTVETDGYAAVQLGALPVKESKKRNVKQPALGKFKKVNLEPHNRLKESRVEDPSSFQVGALFGVEQFEGVSFVDIAGISKGKGYQGGIKRHGFRGGRASHGSSFHRHTGSTGMRSTPGRTLPGKKMAGHMGAERVTVQRIEVLRVDVEKGVLLVKGAVPGCSKSVVYVKKSVKHPQ